jgi:hypothetical protein
MFNLPVNGCDLLLRRKRGGGDVARLTPEVQMTLRQKRGVTMPTDCSVTWISYPGDEGGSSAASRHQPKTAEAVFASITHLRFDPRLPFTREIVVY